MADPFIAEIRMSGFNFAPKGWAFCDGQIMPIQQNTALFSLLGTTYGGNGINIFALPDLRGRVPMHPGQGPGLSAHNLGESGGEATHSLTEAEIPSHTHSLKASAPASSGAPSANTTWATTSAAEYRAASGLVNMANDTLLPAGGGQPHENRQPYIALNFIISLQGVFPPRS